MIYFTLYTFYIMIMVLSVLCLILSQKGKRLQKIVRVQQKTIANQNKSMEYLCKTLRNLEKARRSEQLNRIERMTRPCRN